MRPPCHRLRQIWHVRRSEGGLDDVATRVTRYP
jgi:hypothetical protein